jgi:hypothetical protein
MPSLRECAQTARALDERESVTPGNGGVAERQSERVVVLLEPLRTT